MHNRLNYLLDQYRSAKGIKTTDYSNSFLEDFTCYLKEMKNISYGYTSFLNYLGFNFTDYDTAEIGKGKYDTVVEPFNTTLITTDSKEELDFIEGKRIINGELLVFENEPFIHKYINNKESIVSAPRYIKTYMTQNLYAYKNINGFAALHNNDYNIILGVYGSTLDNDHRKKVKSISRVKDLIDGNYIEEYQTDSGSYYYAIGTTLKRVKIKERIRQYIKDFAPEYKNAYAKKNN